MNRRGEGDCTHFSNGSTIRRTGFMVYMTAGYPNQFIHLILHHFLYRHRIPIKRLILDRLLKLGLHRP